MNSTSAEHKAENANEHAQNAAGGVWQATKDTAAVAKDYVAAGATAVKEAFVGHPDKQYADTEAARAKEDASAAASQKAHEVKRDAQDALGVERQPETLPEKVTAAVGGAWEATKHTAVVAKEAIVEKAVAAKETVFGHHTAGEEAKEAIDTTHEKARDLKHDAKQAVGAEPKPVTEQISEKAGEAWQATKDNATAAKDAVFGKPTAGDRAKDAIDTTHEKARDLKHDAKQAVGAEPRPVTEQISEKAGEAWQATKDNATAAKETIVGKPTTGDRAKDAIDRTHEKAHELKHQTKRAVGAEPKPTSEKVADAAGDAWQATKEGATAVKEAVVGEPTTGDKISYKAKSAIDEASTKKAQYSG